MADPGTPKRLFRYLNERLTRLSHKSAVSTGLLIVSSAALGGIAVAMWNRKTLAALHELEQGEIVSPTQLSEEVEDLFE